MVHSKIYTPQSYFESRTWFRAQTRQLEGLWPRVAQGRHSVQHHSELSIDWIDAPCPTRHGNLLMISTGLHGAEGFTGTTILQHFLNSYLPYLDHQRVGLFLIHAINPWGMNHNRRTNANNVDLNRNFRFAGSSMRAMDNPGYSQLRAILHPERQLRFLSAERVFFVLRILGAALIQGPQSVKQATLKGQEEDPGGLYFGGGEFEEESLVTWKQITERIGSYKQVVHLDIHTGYGAKNSMSLVTSVREPVAPHLWAEQFRYPGVVRADPQAFYSIEGDMIDAIYNWTAKFAPQTSYFGTAFEFGTLGDSLAAEIKSLAAMVFENQVAQHGFGSSSVSQAALKAFRELFNPSDPLWAVQAVQAADKALAGILQWFGLLAEGNSSRPME